MSTNCNFLNYLKASLLNTANYVNYVLVFIHHYIIRFTLLLYFAIWETMQLAEMQCCNAINTFTCDAFQFILHFWDDSRLTCLIYKFALLTCWL